MAITRSISKTLDKAAKERTACPGMNSIAKCLSFQTITLLAFPANVQRGEEIFKSKRVELTEVSNFFIAANVRPGRDRCFRVEMHLTENGLKWKCNCTKRASFCKHCVAVALTIRGGQNQFMTSNLVREEHSTKVSTAFSGGKIWE